MRGASANLKKCAVQTSISASRKCLRARPTGPPYDRDHPEDKRQEVKKGAHDGGNDDQDQEVLWPVIVWVLRYRRHKDERGRNLHTDNA